MSERTCLRCGAPYEEGATICFSCGASIGELETPTQPVRISKKAAPDSAGAAQGTSDVSPAAHEASGEDATAVAAAATAEATPKRVTVGTSLPPPVAEPPARRRRVRWPMVIVAFVAIVALLVGGGFALRAALAGPPVPTIVAYHDPGGRFSVNVPALWTVTRQSDGALLTDSSGANSATISVTSAQAGATASSVADTLAEAQKLQTAPSVPIGGDTWQQRSGQVIGQDGATREIVALVDLHDGDIYTIQLSSPASSFSSINNQVYQPLLASFTFA